MKRRALKGVRILVGRARHQAGALSARLKLLGAEVVEIPFIEIRPPRSYKPLDHALRKIVEYDWLILTSVNGVHACAARMKQLRLNPQALKHLKIAAIGPATRDAIMELGLRVTIVPEDYIAESVVESVQKKVKGKQILLARARIARDVIPRELRNAGAKVTVVEAYETVVPRSSQRKLRRLVSNPKSRPDVVVFTSSSSVKGFVTLLGGTRIAHNRSKSRSQTALDGIQLASIGPITSATLRDYGLPVTIEARRYTIPGLIEAIQKKVRKQT